MTNREEKASCVYTSCNGRVFLPLVHRIILPILSLDRISTSPATPAPALESQARLTVMLRTLH